MKLVEFKVAPPRGRVNSDVRRLFENGAHRMLRQFAIVAILIVVLGFAFRAETQNPRALDQRPSVVSPSSEQRRAIQLRISSHGAPSDFFTLLPVTVHSNFKPDESIYIGLTMTNTAPEPIRVCAFSNPYYQNRPQLTRDGQAVRYLENIRELVRQSDEGTLCIVTRSPDIVDLKTNVPYRVPIIDLREWYGPLTSGHYTLLLKHTFTCCADGQWNSTNLIDFDVTP